MTNIVYIQHKQSIRDRVIKYLIRNGFNVSQSTRNAQLIYWLSAKCDKYFPVSVSKKRAKNMLDLYDRIGADCFNVFPSIAEGKEKKRKSRVNKKEYMASRKARKSASDSFLESWEWTTLRYKALQKHGRVCQCCGAKPPHVVLNVDHIKPRSHYPELALDINNLQVLCASCNKGKGAWDDTDFRN